MQKLPVILAFGLLCLSPLLSPQASHAEPELTEPPFAPTWALMNRVERQNFVAGYLHGMKDAATMTHVLRDFVRENPKSAEESLERLRAIYANLGKGKAPEIAAGIDRFFKDPANREAPLSRAITGASSNQ